MWKREPNKDVTLTQIGRLSDMVPAVQNALKLLAEGHPKAKNRRPEEFTDTSFMDELEKSGFIRKLWQ